MFGILIIAFAIVAVLILLFIPKHWMDRAGLILTVIALCVTSYGVWVTIPSHIRASQSS